MVFLINLDEFYTVNIERIIVSIIYWMKLVEMLNIFNVVVL